MKLTGGAYLLFIEILNNKYINAINLVNIFPIKTRIYLSYRQKKWAKNYLKYLNNLIIHQLSIHELAAFAIHFSTNLMKDLTEFESITSKSGCLCFYAIGTCLSIDYKTIYKSKWYNFLSDEFETFSSKFDKKWNDYSQDRNIDNISEVSVTSKYILDHSVTFNLDIRLHTRSSRLLKNVSELLESKQTVDVIFTKDGNILLSIKINDKKKLNEIPMKTFMSKPNKEKED